MILYAFDIKTKNLKSYNTVKRRFYYHLKKLNVNKMFWNTKSVLAVDDSKEMELDAFFYKFKDYLILFKSKVEKMQKIY